MTSPWPYASLTDPSWLTPPGDPDPHLAAARTAVRGLLPRTSGPATPAQLSAALGAAQQLRERVDWVLLSLVGEARAAGLSWSQVGEALGSSKQAAHQRFAGYVEAALEQAHDQAHDQAQQQGSP